MTAISRSITTSVLMSAIGLAASAAMMTPASAQMNPKMEQKLEQMLKMHPGASKKVIEANMKRVAKDHLARCYGINAIGRNDCASGAHSCAGQATKARDPNSFVLLPVGDCSKIAGGHTKPA